VDHFNAFIEDNLYGCVDLFSVVISHCTFRNNFADLDAVSIRSSGAFGAFQSSFGVENLLIMHSIFENNTGIALGAHIFVKKYFAQYIVFNCTFVDGRFFEVPWFSDAPRHISGAVHVTEEHGGEFIFQLGLRALLLGKCVFSRTTGISGLLAQGLDVIGITDSTFSGLHTDFDGGAISLVTGPWGSFASFNIFMSDVSVQNCTAARNGGGFYFGEAALSEIALSLRTFKFSYLFAYVFMAQNAFTNVSIVGNKAVYGGAIALFAGSSVIYDDHGIEFLDNVATKYGNDVLNMLVSLFDDVKSVMMFGTNSSKVISYATRPHHYDFLNYERHGDGNSKKTWFENQEQLITTCYSSETFQVRVKILDLFNGTVPQYDVMYLQ